MQEVKQLELGVTAAHCLQELRKELEAQKEKLDEKTAELKEERKRTEEEIADGNKAREVDATCLQMEYPNSGKVWEDLSAREYA